MPGIEDLFKREEKEPILADRSKIQSYATCPYMASVNKDEPSSLKDIGSEVHKIIEDALKFGIENQMQPEEIAEYLVEELPKARPDIQPAVIRQGKYIADMIANMQVHRIFGVEYQVDFLTNMLSIEGRPYKLTCCIDLLMGGINSLIVYDWKSGFKRRSREETFDDFQAQFTAYILWQMYPEIETVHWFFQQTFWGDFSYARFDRNKEYPSLPHLTQEMQIQGRIFEALRLWQEESTEAWPEPKKCTWCDCTDVCPHVVDRAKDINKDPKGFIDAMVATEAYLAKLKKTATDYYKKAGEPIKGSETVFEWRKPQQKFTPKIYKAKSEETEDEE